MINEYSSQWLIDNQELCVLLIFTHSSHPYITYQCHINLINATDYSPITYLITHQMLIDYIYIIMLTTHLLLW